MSARSIVVDFYRVVVQEPATFKDLLKTLSDSPEGEGRNVTLRNSGVFRVENLHFRPGVSDTDLVKIRMDFAPSKASIRGGVTPFVLEDHEGVGEETALLFDARLEVIALQRNRYGVSANGAARYFQEVSGMTTPILFEPIINGDAMRRLEGLASARSFEVHVAGASSGSIGRQNYGAKQIAELVRDFGAPSVTISVSMGHKHGSLLIERVKAAARALVGAAENPESVVTAIRVSGANENDEPTYLDLLEDRMAESVDLGTTQDRSIPYAARAHAVREAFDRRKEELNGLFE